MKVSEVRETLAELHKLQIDALQGCGHGRR